MADDEAPTGTGTIEQPLAAFVRGGTSTSADDRQRQMRHVDAERRRDQQDAQFAATRKGTAHLRSMKLGEGDNIVLWVKEHAKESGPRKFLLCTLGSQPDDKDGVEFYLVMHCPRCVFRYNRHPEDTVMTLHQSSRMFTFEPRTPKWLQELWKGALWINPEDANETCLVVGSITMHERGRCPACSLSFTIDDNVLHSMN